jgi:hypothetical protein
VAGKSGYRAQVVSTGRLGGGFAGLKSGATGNERLTALAGATLLLLLAVEGVTIVFLQPLIQVHFFVGMLLIGPVLLKVGSTGYRFVRYYTGAPEYRRKGPPAPLLRLLGPIVVLTSLAVIGSGIALAFDGPGHDLILKLHKASFILWFGAMTIHVLVYVWRVPGLVAADMRGPRGRHGIGASADWAGNGSSSAADLAHRSGARAAAGMGTSAWAVTGERAQTGAGLTRAGWAARWVLVAIALAAGLVIAAATLHLAAPWAALHGHG